MVEQNQSKSVASLVFGILLLVVMMIVILIQLTIIITFFMTQNKGRCVYKDENGSCICKFTNKKSCDSVNGIYNTNLSCEDGFDLLCAALPPLTPTESPAPTAS
jgi:hypothetical protein